MAGTGTNTAKLSLDLESNAAEVSDSVAKGLEKVRSQAEASQAKIADYSASLKRLKGNSDEVKSAKAQLTAKINSEKDALSAANLQLLKSGTSYEKLTAKAKKLKEAQEELKKKTASGGAASQGFGKGLEAVGGPASDLKGKLSGLTDLLGGAEGAEGLAALGAAALAAAILLVVVAVAAGAIALSKWIVMSANAARTANLFREAATGSAQNALNLGTQIDALARKVPTAKAELNTMAIEMAKGGIEGQTLVDTLNAVGQASAALGNDAGAKLKEFIDRGRLSQRFQVAPIELKGTGINIDDLAGSLAKDLGIQIGEAKQRLAQGKISLAQGAKAMREAVESKLGGINLRRMLDLNVLSEKFKEKLEELTHDVNLEPLLKGFAKLSALFDENSYTGYVLKQAITSIGNSLGTTFEKAVPYMIQFIKGLILASLDIVLAFYQVRNALKGAFGDNTALSNIDWMTTALEVGKLAVYTFVAGIVLMGAAVALALAPFVWLGIKVYEVTIGLIDAFKYVYNWFGTIDWSATGKGIIDGLVKGLKGGAAWLVDTVKGLADKVKNTFKDALGIKSPSKVFAEYGSFTAQGFAQGVDDGSPEAQGAVNGMASIAPAQSGGSSGGGGGGRGGDIYLGGLHVSITGDGANDSAKLTAAAESLADQVMDILATRVQSAGVPAT